MKSVLCSFPANDAVVKLDKAIFTYYNTQSKI